MAFVGLCGLTARTASGSSGDESATKLRKLAIYQDYLATDFAEAEKKLLLAISLCDGPSTCSPALVARLHCDLGVVEFVLEKRDLGRTQFNIALDRDPAVELDPDVSTPEVQAAFAELKAGRTTASAGAPEHPAPPSSGSPPGPAEGSAGPPAEGTAASDCPPGFPGCKSSEDSSSCTSDEGCGTGRTCKEGACTPSEPEGKGVYRENWVNLAFEQDLLLLDSKGDACAGGTGYTCFGSGGAYYSAAPYPKAGDTVNGGLAPATMRLLVGYDRAVTANIALGARLGYALGGGPTRPTASSFLPFHAEARATYWFGRGLAGRGLRFFAVAGAGVAEVDASMHVDVYSSLDAYKSGQSQPYQAWHKSGLGFGALGGGAMYAFTPNTGLILELRGMQMFPTSSSALGIQLGYGVGL